jgi:hypothetical protein
MVLEEALKASGYTDADLEALKPTLSDPKFRTALETQFGVVESRASKAEQEASGWADWYEKTAKPTVDDALRREQEASAKAAAATARLKTLQEQGLIKLAEEAGEPVEHKPTQDVFDPKKYKLVTEDDVAKFGNQYGQAITMVQDVAAEYSDLFPGKSLFSYQTTDSEGRTIRGVTALRQEAIAANKRLDQYIADKFKFSEARTVREAEAKSKAEQAIRDDQRAKDIAELANPMARPPQNSQFTMLPKPRGDAKQPWESDVDPSIARVQRVLTKVLQ